MRKRNVKGTDRPPLPLKHNKDGVTNTYNLERTKGIANDKVYEAVLAAKREFIINNIALEMKINSLYQRSHSAQADSYSKKRSRWRLVRNVFSFVCFINSKLISKKVMGLELPQRYQVESENSTLDFAALKWLSGGLSESSIKVFKRKKYLLYEDSVILTTWTYLLVLLFIYTAIFLPFRISFIQNDSAGLNALDIIVNLMFIVDIILTFFTTYVHKGVIVEDIKLIILKYTQTWLALDILSVIPFDYFISSENSRLNNFTKLIRIIKLLRILRLIKMSKRLSKNKVTRRITGFFNINRQFSDLLVFFSIILLLTHIATCLWYFIASISISPSWIDRLHPKPTTSADIYIVSFYWAISTICTVGFGDIGPFTMIEKLFNIAWIGVGVAFYSYTLGTLSSLLNNLNRKKSVISSRFAFMNQFASEMKIDKALLERITTHLEFLEESNKYTKDNISLSFLKDISLDLTYELAKHLHKDLLANGILFESKNVNFLAQTLPYLVPRKLRPGEILYKQNEYPNFLYFILEGRVGFFNDSNIMFNTYIEGSYFGEIEIFKSCLRQYQAKALTEVKVLILPREVLMHELGCLQELYEQLYRSALMRDIINKRYSRKVYTSRLLTNNNIISDDKHIDLYERKRDCFQAIQDLKKRVNAYANHAKEKYTSVYGDQSEQLIGNNDSVKKSFFDSIHVQGTEEMADFVKNEAVSQVATQLKERFTNLRSELVSNNRMLRMLLGQCLGQNIEFMPYSMTLNKGIHCDLTKEHTFSDVSLKEIENNFHNTEIPFTVNFDRITDQGRKKTGHARSIKVYSPSSLSPKSQKSKDLPSLVDEKPDATAKLHRVNLFEDDEFKRLCKQNDLKNDNQSSLVNIFKKSFVLSEEDEKFS